MVLVPFASPPANRKTSPRPSALCVCIYLCMHVFIHSFILSLSLSAAPSSLFQHNTCMPLLFSFDRRRLSLPPLLVQKRKSMPRTDWWVFWGALYATPLVWAILALVNIFSGVGSILIAVVALPISCANVWGYSKCSRAADRVIKSTVQSGLIWAAGHMVTSNAGDESQ